MGVRRHRSLVTADDFKFYASVIWRLFGPMCVFGQVIKKWCKGRVRSVKTKVVIGTSEDLDDALLRSEDSSRLNTSFIERLNLTIRQGSAYLSRRSLAHARSPDLLEGHLELLRCHYGFVRPHSALKFGREMRTPAMQAGLATKALTFREIFTSSMMASHSFVLLLVSPDSAACLADTRRAA